MTESPTEVVESVAPPARSRRQWRRVAVVLAVMLLLFGVPWWTLLAAGTAWPTPVYVPGAVSSLPPLRAFPGAMSRPRPHHRDWAAPDRRHHARRGLGAVRLVGPRQVLLRHPALAGVADPARSRPIAAVVVVIAVVLLLWGYAEAMRVPRVRRVDVNAAPAGAGLDGLRVSC